jgi:tetratricopeptide (TPR) repeat protein
MSRGIGGGVAACLLLASIAGASQMTDELHRKEAREFYQLGQAHMQSEEWDQAEAAFKQAVQLDPLFTFAHYSLGQVYMHTRAYPSAVRAFTGCKDAFAQLAALASTDRAAADMRLDEEIRNAKDAIVAFEANRPKINQGTTDAREGDMRLEARLESLERQKRRGFAHLEVPAEFSLALGSAYLRNGQLPEAEHEYQEALKVNPKMGEAYNNLAVIYMRSGRLDEAANAVKQAEKTGFKVHPQLKKDIATGKS